MEYIMNLSSTSTGIPYSFQLQQTSFKEHITYFTTTLKEASQSEVVFKTDNRQELNVGQVLKLLPRSIELSLLFTHSFFCLIQ